MGEGQLVGSVLEGVGSSTGALGESVGEWLGDAVSRAVSQAINNVVGGSGFLAGFNLLCRQGWAGMALPPCQARTALIRLNQLNACSRQDFKQFGPFLSWLCRLTRGCRRSEVPSVGCATGIRAPVLVTMTLSSLGKSLLWPMKGLVDASQMWRTGTSSWGGGGPSIYRTLYRQARTTNLQNARKRKQEGRQGGR